MKQSIWALSAMVLAVGHAQGQTPATIIGKWKGEDQPDKQSEIYLAGDGLYYGKSLAGTGKAMFKKLRYDSASKTFKGMMAPPDINAELNVTISFANNDRLRIVARKMLLSKTIYMVRIK